MRRLKGQDAAFWFGETPAWHMHVGSLGIVDISDAPDYSFDLVRKLLIERLPQLPQFRWKAFEVPLGIDRPVWVEDDAFDPDYHIRRIAVPPPGDHAQLEDLVGHLFSYKLNRDRPLWELWVIEGLADGRIAVLAKVHHAIVDGVSGAGLGEILLDIEPTPRPAPDSVAPDEVARAPSSGELLAQGMVNAAFVMPVRTARVASQMLGQAVSVAGYARRSARPSFPLFDAPRVSFDGELTPHRRLSGATVELARLKAIKDTAGVKLNDVVLALCSGVLARYLDERGELPDRSLIAQVPVSLRTDADKDDVGSKVGTMFVSLATEMADPAERLERIAESSQSAKEMRRALSARGIIGISEAAPPALIGLAARAISLTGLTDGTRPPVNVVISNVPGPPFPLYMAGGLVEHLLPLGPLLLGIGLNITVFSYRDQLDVGFLSCPELLAEPALLADSVEGELALLERAVGIA